jgi:hypothetical protein
MTTATLTSIGASVQHLVSIKAKIDKLGDARAAAEEQITHRVGAAYRAGEISLQELADIAAVYQESSGPGGRDRWDTAVGVSLVKLRAIRRFRPNGPHGSWFGDHPLSHDAPRPIQGQNVVYVLYDEAAKPCYVGSTKNFSGRMSGHRKDGKKWSHWTAFPCDSREAAFVLETRLLREEMPYLNRRRSA